MNRILACFLVLSMAAQAVTVREFQGDVTFGNGNASTSTFTYDLSSGTDPVWTVTDGVVNLSTGSLQLGGTAVATINGANISAASDWRLAIELPAIDIRDYGLTSGTGLTTEQRTDNTTKLQTAANLAGTSGRRLIVTEGPYEINDNVLLSYQGIQIVGSGFNWESNNTSRIIQTATDKAVFKLAIPAGGYVNTHGLYLADLWLSGAGEGTSTAAGIDCYLDGPAGEVYSDFTVFERLRIDGCDQGLKLAKFSNSGITNVSIYDCSDAVWIGGNCNAVTFTSCQFNEFPSDGHAFWAIGSAQIALAGTNEYGNGGNFLDFNSGVTGFSMEIEKLAVENQEVSSRIASANSLNITAIRFIAGSYATTVPFKFEAGSFGSIKNDSMSWGVGGFRAESSGAATMTISTPSAVVVTKASHGFVVGDRLVFTTNGALPTGLTAGRSVFVTSVPTADTFTISYTRGGTEIVTSGSQSGTHTVTRPKLPLAYGTISSAPQRNHNQYTTVAPGTIEIYTDNNFATYEGGYGFNYGKLLRDDGAVTMSEGFRGDIIFKMRRDSLGATYPDDVKVAVKAWGEIVEKDILNDALLRTTSSTAATLTLVSNTRYRATGGSSQAWTLPTVPRVDDEIEIIVQGAGGVVLDYPTGFSIRQGSSVTTVSSGTLTLSQGDVCRLKYYASGQWQVIGGNFNGTTS